MKLASTNKRLKSFWRIFSDYSAIKLTFNKNINRESAIAWKLISVLNNPQIIEGIVMEIGKYFEPSIKIEVGFIKMCRIQLKQNQRKIL